MDIWSLCERKFIVVRSRRAAARDGDNSSVTVTATLINALGLDLDLSPRSLAGLRVRRPEHRARCVLYFVSGVCAYSHPDAISCAGHQAFERRLQAGHCQSPYMTSGPVAMRDQRNRSSQALLSPSALSRDTDAITISSALLPDDHASHCAAPSSPTTVHDLPQEILSEIFLHRTSDYPPYSRN